MVKTAVAVVAAVATALFAKVRSLVPHRKVARESLHSPPPTPAQVGLSRRFILCSVDGGLGVTFVQRYSAISWTSNWEGRE